MALIKLKLNGLDPSSSRRQVFLSSGTFTVPSGITKVYVSICAGGGAGQNQGASQSGGGGAGVLWLERTVTPAAAIAVTIGAASSGTFGGGAHGVDGNDSKFGTSGQGWYIECDGGKGSNTQKGGLYTNSSPNQVSGGGNPTQFGGGASVFGAGNARGTNNGTGRGLGTGGAGGNGGHNGMGGAAGYCVVEW